MLVLLAVGSLAAADEPPDGLADGAPASAPSPPVETAVLRGRVMERGTINPVGRARIVAGDGYETESDAHGDFELKLPPGERAIVILTEDHDPLHVSEKLVANEGVRVEYRLLPKDEKKRYRS